MQELFLSLSLVFSVFFFLPLYLLALFFPFLLSFLSCILSLFRSFLTSFLLAFSYFLFSCFKEQQHKKQYKIIASQSLFGFLLLLFQNKLSCFLVVVVVVLLTSASLDNIFLIGKSRNFFQLAAHNLSPGVVVIGWCAKSAACWACWGHALAAHMFTASAHTRTQTIKLIQAHHLRLAILISAVPLASSCSLSFGNRISCIPKTAGSGARLLWREGLPNRKRLGPRSPDANQLGLISWGHKSVQNNPHAWKKGWVHEQC